MTFSYSDHSARPARARRWILPREGHTIWLFAGSDNGGRTAAVLFSLIAACQRHQVEPISYLRDVLTRIAATPITQLANLLPDRWQPAAAN